MYVSRENREKRKSLCPIYLLYIVEGGKGMGQCLTKRMSAYSREEKMMGFNEKGKDGEERNMSLVE